jgi:hypothetical protein
VKRLVYAVYDKKMAEYGPPVAVGHVIEAERWFDSLVNGEGIVARYPGDFALYRIGDYDPLSGTMTAEAPVFIVDGASLVRYEEVRQDEDGDTDGVRRLPGM